MHASRANLAERSRQVMHRRTFPCHLHSHIQMDYLVTDTTMSYSAPCAKYSQKEPVSTAQKNSETTYPQQCSVEFTALYTITAKMFFILTHLALWIQNIGENRYGVSLYACCSENECPKGEDDLVFAARIGRAVNVQTCTFFIIRAFLFFFFYYSTGTFIATITMKSEV